MEIIALQSHKTNNRVTITDTKGESTTSKDPNEILASLVAPYPDCIKAVWDMEAFLKPILKLLPAEVVKKLNNGEKARFGDFKLFYGVGKGAVFGVDWLVREHDKGNFYTEDKYESNIYELKLYYPNEQQTSLNEVRAKGQFLIDTLQGMGMNPTKLTSMATIYEECVLRRMNLYTIFDMPEEALEMAEWATNYCREWRTTYKLGHFDRVWDYDKTSAYPSILAQIPNLQFAKYIKTKGNIPSGMFWGILKGRINITADISPIVHSDGKCYKGAWDDFITTTDWACIKRWNIGTFIPQSGWFLKFSKLEYPFDEPMRCLYALRDTDNELQTRLAKNMANTVWGKFAERRGSAFGDYFQPIYASMVTSRMRADVANFIYNNNSTIHLISVTVDGVLLSHPIETPKE